MALPQADSVERIAPDFEREKALIASGIRYIAGIDEAGRGPLAGPVVAAAVILDPAAIPPGLDDSKRLSAAARERLFGEIVSNHAVGVGVVCVARIDRDNIRRATFQAMIEALDALPLAPGHALIDGCDLPRTSLPCTAIIDGDALSLSIAAASVIAKVWRDRIMDGLAQLHPGYGFERHRGYATREHRDALTRLGPCAQHRRSFRPIRPDREQ